MFPFKKNKDYLLCIDSDGTIMDTMTIKHEKCFGPLFLDVMNIQKHRDEILKEWLEINLYSKSRGINRFQGFDQICHFIEETYQTKIKGLKDFDSWIDSTKEFSVNSILQYQSKAEDFSLFEKALVWSKEVNESIKKLPPSQAFQNVDTILSEAKDKVDLVGVSSANKEAVIEEWTRLNIIQDFLFVGCQDSGNKSHIIKESLQKGYSKKNSLMLGDAIGDYQAAKENGILFFPIIPKREVESWQRLKKEGLPNLLSGKFDDDYQKKLMDDFFNSLK